VLVATVAAQRQAELRVSYRKSLEPFVADLGNALHQIIATSQILAKTSDETYAKWREANRKAQAKLKELRPNLRYSLLGADDALRTLTRVPDWADHLRREPERFSQLMKDANRLLAQVDSVVRRGFVQGKPPRLLTRILLNHYSEACKTTFNAKQPVLTPDEEILKLFLDYGVSFGSVAPLTSDQVHDENDRSEREA